MSTLEVKSDAILKRLLSLHPKVIDLSLGRLEKLLDRLGNPERKIPPVIHVAGTNGKGSVCAMLRAGLEGAGKRVHTYTSPHLVHFHERIRVAGTLISEQDLSDLLEECERVNGQDQITFFEITTAAAFLAFSRVEADYTILEVGLGGRLDATNVISDPRLCVITPVSLDHQQYLGETLQEIAFEKAGIVKSGVPCVVGFQQDQAQAVIEHVAREKNAPLRCLGVDWSVWLENDTRLVFQNTQGLMDLPKSVLHGNHQVENAGIALAALTELGFSEAVCQKALLNASWPARLQRLKPESFPQLPEGSEIWLDGGHNAAAGQILGVFFADLSEKRSTPLYLICGMLKTKDAEKFLSPFKGLARHVFGVTIEGEENSFSGQDIQAYALKAGLPASSVNTLQDAITGITHSHYGETPPRIFICGSLYFAGQVLRSL